MKKCKIILILSFLVLKLDYLYSQVTAVGTARPTTSAFVGWDNTTANNGSLQIRNDYSDMIEFWTNGNPYLQLKSDGNVNFVDNTKGVQLNNVFVLRNNGISTNIYVGESAGNTNSTSENTFVGYSTGPSAGNTANGYKNTFVGAYAGTSNNQGYHNTFLGGKAGYSNVQGNSNTMVGFEAGYVSTGNYNSYVGRYCGYSNTGISNSFLGKDAGYSGSGSNNVYIGSHAGYTTGNGGGNVYSGVNCGYQTTGNDNAFYGNYAGINATSGDNNIFIGGHAQDDGGSYPTINNSIVIGNRTVCTGNKKMILGRNDINVGIGLSDDNVQFGPQNDLEINSDPNSFATHSGYDKSGLRFRQLTSASTNNMLTSYGKVLTVDQNGDVVLTTDDNGDFGYGICNSPTTLPGHIGMRMNDYNIYYEGIDLATNAYDMNYAIGLGYSCSSVLPAKFSVNQTFTSSTQSVDVPTIAGYFHNGDVTTNRLSFQKRGLLGVCDGYSNGDDQNNITNIGGEFIAQNSEYLNIGVSGRTGIYAFDRTYGTHAFGGFFESKGSTYQTIGVYGYTDAAGSSVNYGVYGNTAVDNCGSGWCVSAAAFFNGDVYCTTGNYWPSDNVLKSNVQTLNNNVDVIKSLAPKTYTYNHISNLNLPNGIQAGLIAQDVQSVLPQLIGHFKVPAIPDSTGFIDTTGTGATYLGINYVGLIPYLVGAVKEQQENIDSLNQKLSDLQDQINGCCTSNGHLRKSNNVNLSDPTTIVLNQNSPNPFSEETYITFNIPAAVSKAMIIIYDKTGNILKSVVIEERGEGSLHVFAEKLSSGIYTYSLVADGVTVDTKQMVCTK